MVRGSGAFGRVVDWRWWRVGGAFAGTFYALVASWKTPPRLIYKIIKSVFVYFKEIAALFHTASRIVFRRIVDDNVCDGKLAQVISIPYTYWA